MLTLKDPFGPLHLGSDHRLLSNAGPQLSAKLPHTKKTLQEKEKRREAPGQDFSRTMTEDNNICLECKKTTKDVDCEGNQTF